MAERSRNGSYPAVVYRLIRYTGDETLLAECGVSPGRYHVGVSHSTVKRFLVEGNWPTRLQGKMRLKN